MIKLYQFPSCWGIPNASPFCAKLETYLRMTKLPFEIKKVMDPRKAPKGKLPYIEDNGIRIADTDLIIAYLKEKYGDVLDANQTPAQHAQSTLIQRTLEEHLYWCMLYSRWMDDSNWPETKRTLFAKVPFLIRSFLANSIRKKMRTSLHEQGIGRHTSHEIYQMGLNDLTALNTLLSNNTFLLGNQASSIDASLYAFLINLIYVPTTSPMNEYAKSQQNFIEYCARIKSLYYPSP